MRFFRVGRECSSRIVSTLRARHLGEAIEERGKCCRIVDVVEKRGDDSASAIEETEAGGGSTDVDDEHEDAMLAAEDLPDVVYDLTLCKLVFQVVEASGSPWRRSLVWGVDFDKQLRPGPGSAGDK